MNKILDNLVNCKILPEFDENILSEEEEFYLCLKNKDVYDFLKHCKNLKEKYPSFCYLPKHFNNKEFYRINFYQKSFVNLDVCFDKITNCLKNYNLTNATFLIELNKILYKNNAIYRYSTNEILYFENKKSCKEYLKDEIDKL